MELRFPEVDGVPLLSIGDLLVIVVVVVLLFRPGELAVVVVVFPVFLIDVLSSTFLSCASEVRVFSATTLRDGEFLS